MNYNEMYRRLMPIIGNAYGVCAAIGGIRAESAGNSQNVQNSYEKKIGMGDEAYTKAVDNGTYTKFATDAVGYGFCQWTSSGRKRNLLNFAKARGTSIGDDEMQLDFMVNELNTSYKAVLKVLMNATSVKEASDYFTKKYERPKDQSEAALARRAGYGEEFYQEFVVKNTEKQEGEVKMIKPVDYKQTDTRWKSNKYAVDGESSTIGSAGCGPTALADCLAAIVSPYIDPLTLAAWSRDHNYKVKNSGTSYNFFVPCAAEYGVTVHRLNTSNVYGKPTNAVHAQAMAALQDGNWIIACMGKGLWTSSGHYVVAYGHQNGNVYINDPASSKESRACNKWQTFISQVKYYWVVEVPEHIKKNGIVKDGEYRQEDFVREVQMCCGAGIDGKAGPQTISKTITVSKVKNRKHNVVLPLQKALKKKNHYQGALDRITGSQFESAVNSYQKWVLDCEEQDGEITAKGKMWKSLLRM